jgi:hypothetical protein
VEARRAEELRRVAGEVAPFLWASLSARLRAARRELEETLAAQRRERAGEPGERALARPAGGVAEELREGFRRAGWCLGVLGAGLGVDLVRARREPEGLRWLVEALAEARALDLSPSAGELPRLAPETSAALELPLLAAWCVLRAGALDGVVRWSAERAQRGWRLAFELGAGLERAELAARCARLSSTRGSPCLALGPARLELT